MSISILLKHKSHFQTKIYLGRAFNVNHRLTQEIGASLIELIIFIVIVSVGIVGILSVMNVTTKHSPDPMLRKQAIAIAESLLEEVYLRPFTYCDPDDPNALTASSAAGCTGGAGGSNDQSRLVLLQLAPQAGETRYSNTMPFDNVADYNGFSMKGIKPITDSTTAIPGLETFDASVAVTQVGGGAEFPSFPAAEVLKIVVTVSQSGGGDSITLTGYRFRADPNMVP